MIKVLRRPFESALAAGVVVMDQPREIADTVATPCPDRHLEGIEDQFGGHRGGRPPADDPAGEHIEDEGDVDRPRPGRDIGEVRDPEPVGSGRSEVPVDQIRRPGVLGGRDRGPGVLAPQRSRPALGGHQPLHSAPRHVVAVAAQMQPHLPGTEPDTELVLACRSNQLDDLGITQRALRRSPVAGFVVGRGSDLDAVLGQHAADRLDSVDLTVIVDEVD
jgi:hypothetical protein